MRLSERLNGWRTIYKISAEIMIGLIQRVRSATVTVQEEPVGHIEAGILLLLGIEKADDYSSADKLLHKILNYRIFSDHEGRMNKSLTDINGGLLVVSQFTLAADTKKGLRPSFSSAARPQQAEALYDYFVSSAAKQHKNTQRGKFAANMQISLINDGPVTFKLET